MLVWWGIACPAVVDATVPEYMCEVGLQVGCGYYVGDASKMIFNNIREAFGGQFRYNFDRRWAMQIKAQRQRIAFSYTPERTNEIPQPSMLKFQNPMWHVDASAEFNFFRFGLDEYDARIKACTPYISLGVGITMCNKVATPYSSDNQSFPAVQINKGSEQVGLNFGGCYIPVGIGVKWKFAPQWQLQACWQHQIYISDNLEGYMHGYDTDDAIKNNLSGILNNSHELNGVNIFNNDLTSTLTIGVMFEFGKCEKLCYFCED